MSARKAFADFFPVGIEFEFQPVCLPGVDETSDAERALVSGMAVKRQREFLSGRAAARRALIRLGVRSHDLLIGSAREPLWPPDVSGSISHTEHFCLVAVAPRDHFPSLGLDCAPDQGLAEALWPRICTEEELKWIHEQPGRERHRWAQLFFCAKEAAYKYHYPLAQAYLGFQALSVRLDTRTERFSMQPSLASPLQEARGAWRRAEGLLVCLVIPSNN